MIVTPKGVSIYIRFFCDRIIAVLASGETGKHKLSSALEIKAAAEDAKDQEHTCHAGEYSVKFEGSRH